MKCTKCGKEVEEGSHFCCYCGRVLTDFGKNAYKERKSLLSCYTKEEVVLLEELKAKFTLSSAS